MPGETYRAAGVDLGGLDALKERLKAYCRATQGQVGQLSSRGFAGVYPLKGYRSPVLVASTDGVGTKLKVAALLGHWEGIGVDLVHLNVNDALTWGARPLFFLDYISTSRLDLQAIDALARGMAWACRQTGCALLGGETAQMPGVYRDDDMDLAGFLVGVVEEGGLVDGSDIVEGDVLLGIPSSGLHTNGFSLVRRVFGIDDDPSVLYRSYSELGHSLGEELLIPHRCYFPILEPVLPLVKGIVHVTGGGLPSKVPLVLPSGLAASFRLATWDIPPIFSLVAHVGKVVQEEMYQVFNMGLGMVLVCSPQQMSGLQEAIPDARWVGEVVAHRGGERVVIH